MLRMRLQQAERVHTSNGWLRLCWSRLWLFLWSPWLEWHIINITQKKEKNRES